jgi:hypothetical protein
MCTAGRPSAAHHVVGKAGLTDLDTELSPRKYAGHPTRDFRGSFLAHSSDARILFLH